MSSCVVNDALSTADQRKCSEELSAGSHIAHSILRVCGYTAAADQDWWSHLRQTHCNDSQSQMKNTRGPVRCLKHTAFIVTNSDN